MKETRKYYFSVEGETEKWYLDWLQEKINNEPESKHKVSIHSKVQKDPIKHAKAMIVLSKVEITHLIDYESNDEIHTKKFQETLDKLKGSSNLGKQIKYYLGYCNFTFELWMVLHKTICNAPLDYRWQYLDQINRAYCENFENLSQYKQESNFKRVLGKISLPEVNKAIERAKDIMQRNDDNGMVLQKYKGYQYYRENPSLSIWESTEKILKDCELI